MLGRHNVTLYADEVERCIGGIRRLASTREMGETEQAYWMGAVLALEHVMRIDIPDNWQAFIAAMQLCFTGEQPGELVEENQTDKE